MPQESESPTVRVCTTGRGRGKGHKIDPRVTGREQQQPHKSRGDSHVVDEDWNREARVGVRAVQSSTRWTRWPRSAIVSVRSCRRESVGAPKCERRCCGARRQQTCEADGTEADAQRARYRWSEQRGNRSPAVRFLHSVALLQRAITSPITGRAARDNRARMSSKSERALHPTQQRRTRRPQRAHVHPAYSHLPFLLLPVRPPPMTHNPRWAQPAVARDQRGLPSHRRGCPYATLVFVIFRRWMRDVPAHTPATTGFPSRRRNNRPGSGRPHRRSGHGRVVLTGPPDSGPPFVRVQRPACWAGGLHDEAEATHT